MFIVGIVYLALGILVRLGYLINPRKIQTVHRISLLFIMVGLLNTLLHAFTWLVPEFKTPATVTGMCSIIVFCIVMLFETNKDYRKFRNRVDKLLGDYKEKDEK